MDIIEFLDWASVITGLVLAAVGLVLSFYSAQKRKDVSLFHYLLTGFYACIFMSNAYYLLVWFLEDYPYVFSPGDLSWVGAIVFLITAVLVKKEKLKENQKKAAKKYRLPALAAPCVCAAFNIAYISIYPELIINYLLYAIPTLILSWLTLLYLLAGLKGEAQPVIQKYHLAILVWIVVQLFNDLFSSLGFYNGFAVHGIICEFLLAAATLAIYFASRKEAEA